MNNYDNIKATLIGCEYRFDKEKTKSNDIKLSYQDRIIISSIRDDKIDFVAERKLRLNGNEDSFIIVKFETSIIIEKPISKEQFGEDIRKGLPLLGGVYSKISLMISEISSMSPFGAIITPPLYSKNMEVE